MRIEIGMATDEEKLSINSWWAKTPDSAVEALRRQLAAAAVIWPELSNLRIGVLQLEEDKTEVRP